MWWSTWNRRRGRVQNPLRERTRTSPICRSNSESVSSAALEIAWTFVLGELTAEDSMRKAPVVPVFFAYPQTGFVLTQPSAFFPWDGPVFCAELTELSDSLKRIERAGRCVMGKIVSLIIIVVLWKPYYLFTQGIKEPVSTYWKNVGKYYLCFFISLGYMIGSMYLFKVKPSPEIISMILFGIKIVIPTIILYAILLYKLGNGFREITNRIPLTKKLQRKDH